MKVKITHPVTKGEYTFLPGSVIELDDATAAEVIARDHGFEFVEDGDEAPKRGKKAVKHDEG
jgi:hypothetical protein